MIGPRWLFRVVGTASMLVIAAATAGRVEAAEKNWPSRVTVGGGPLQGTIQTQALGWASLLNKKLGINASVESTAGAAVNARLLSTGQQDLATGVISGIAIEAYTGAGFAKGTKYTNLRLLVPLEALPAQFWTPRKSGIKSIEQIAGKRVNLSRPGSGVDVFGRKMLAAAGLNVGQITSVDHSQANDMMQDGILDVAATLGSPPHPAIAAITTQADYVVFGMGHGDLARKTMEAIPSFSPTTIPGGAYKGNPDPIQTIGEQHWLGAGAHVPESLAYEVTKATFENKAELVVSHASWRYLDFANVATAKIPVHPGAIRYYKEKGIKVPKAAMP